MSNARLPTTGSDPTKPNPAAPALEALGIPPPGGAAALPPDEPERRALLPGEYPLPLRLGPAAAISFRTPLQEHPPAADTKAGSILTLTGIMVTVLTKFAPNMDRILTRGGWEKWLLLALLLAFAAIAVYAVVHAFHTIAPRFPKAPPSLAFYGDIAKLSREQYVGAVKSLSSEQALDQMLDYNHTVSAICVEKFRQLRMGMKAFKAAFPVWALTMALVILDEVVHGHRD